MLCQTNLSSHQQHRPYTRYYTFEQPYTLSCGADLPNITVAYETYGQLSSDKDNVILLTHALTGDAHAASHGADDPEPGWWEALIGPGKLLDTNQYFIICSNVLGGCQGTTGPASIDPHSGRPYAKRFPTVLIRDMVKVQHQLLLSLGISHILAVIGGSMGGMQSLEWAVSYPDFMDGVVVIAAPAYAHAQSIAYSRVGRQAIELDPDFCDGDYYGSANPTRGLAIARSLGIITYQSDLSMTKKFGRRTTKSGRYEIERYLDYQGDSLVRRFDANSYLCLSRALEDFDVADGYRNLRSAFQRVQAPMLVVGISTDILYPPYQQQEIVHGLQTLGRRVEYREIDSIHGHDGFLIDFWQLEPMLDQFLRDITHNTIPIFKPRAFRATQLAYLGAQREVLV